VGHGGQEEGRKLRGKLAMPPIVRERMKETRELRKGMKL
jgi:hypothetical protein